MKGLGLRAQGLGLAFGSLTLAVLASLAQPISLAQEAAPFRVEQLTSPAGEDTMAPQLAAEGDRVVLSWLDIDEDLPALKFSERTSSGWSEARTVVSNEALMVNPADVPIVRPLPGGALAAAWLEVNSDDDEAYDLKVARSADAGRTWSTPTTPHHDATKTQHGFASIVPTAGGGFLIVWLDGRATHPGARTPAEAGSMTLRAAEFDAKGAQRNETLIDARVCDCCPLSMTVASGAPLVVFRDRSADEIRDIALARLTGGQMDDAVDRAPRRVENRGLSGQRTIRRGERFVGGGGLVHRGQRQRPRVCGVLEGCRGHLRRARAGGRCRCNRSRANRAASRRRRRTPLDRIAAVAAQTSAHRFDRCPVRVAVARRGDGLFTPSNGPATRRVSLRLGGLCRRYYKNPNGPRSFLPLKAEIASGNC